ncbi:hypothetical protein N7478_011850 [Penicillium angulare]|uniref:uncharacterized protein n=1 Tax=Penicillium angulare TaxID=116970 RepID=UPI00253F924C|nr:uncharacterized protein N7478_011850 [Penicillium angulare]KAJ5261255.1 hypothetical protein N7478_011850 [Penicillium angulare]
MTRVKDPDSEGPEFIRVVDPVRDEKVGTDCQIRDFGAYSETWASSMASPFIRVETKDTIVARRLGGARMVVQSVSEIYYEKS